MKQRVAAFSLSLIVLVGCSKNELGTLDESMMGSSSALCADAGSNGELSVVGQAASEAGNTVAYSAAQNGSCINGKSVNWKVAGASASRSSSSGLISVFNKAGSYVVTAQSKTGQVQSASLTTTVVKEDIVMTGPQAGFSFDPLTFSLVIPSSASVASVSWDFGDGSAIVQNQNSVTYAFSDVGEYTVKVSISDERGKVTQLSRRVTIVTRVDGLSCLTEFAISGAKEAKVGVATQMSVFIPSCAIDKIGAVRWDFGDSSTGSNQTVSHAYAAEGVYDVTAKLYLGNSQEALVTLDHQITVTKDLVEEPEEPEEPANPHACVDNGEIRTSQGELSSEEVACGIDGHKTVTYRESIKEKCQLVGETLQWAEISRDKEVTNEGSCQGQSCTLPDGSKLSDGASKVLYSNVTPPGTCSSVSESRTCNNGVLSGSPSYVHNTCNNGCGEFGGHGTVKTNVVTGEIKVAKECSFQEQGFFDTFTQVSDQTCKDGSVVNSNTHQGTLKEAGSCPVYTFVPSENFTACSADCGGKQTRIFICKDDKGNVVDNARCGIAAPVEERLCDANPEAVRRSESTTATEEANSSATCPKNQIGVITNVRDVVTTKTYACIDHSVQLENTAVVPGAWVETKLCREYVAHRCSQDSLSNSQAQGRYDWMVKCQDQLPVIKKFITELGDTSVKIAGQEITFGASRGRELYASFMDRAFNPEKPWIAPTKASAACVMPETAYVATVCVSSCATPEQQIMAEEASSKKMKYVSFIDALTQKTAYVASLRTASMDSKAVAKVKVDQWVTELIDTEHEILVFKMKSGRELRVTKNHPILTEDGMMKKADEFKSGESLVQLGGSLDRITSIEEIKHFGKVYNLFVSSDEAAKNIVVTNGYLNGTAYFQNAGAKDMNRSLFRSNMTRGVFGK
jgi:FOG: PKD repeat